MVCQCSCLSCSITHTVHYAAYHVFCYLHLRGIAGLKYCAYRQSGPFSLPVSLGGQRFCSAHLQQQTAALVPLHLMSKQALLCLQPDRGTIFMEMLYTPFRAAGKAAAGNTPGAQKSNMTLGLSKKNLTSDHKGLLTVTLIRCIDLEVSMLPAVHCRVAVAQAT